MLRKSLFSERRYFGPYPLTVEDNIEWSEKVYQYKNVVDQINKKIAKFNLVVPVLNKQMLQICLEKEAQTAMVLGKGYEDLRNGSSTQDDRNKDKRLAASDSDSINIFAFIDFLFKTK